MGNIVLISIGKEELQELVRSAVKSELQNKQQKELMNFKETREYLGISTSTLNKWKSTDTIPFKRLGKRIFFNRADVLQALKDSNYSKLRDLQ